MRPPLKVLITAGGSGGHIFPAVALARKLVEQQKDIQILFVGSGRKLDAILFKREGFRYALLTANRLPEQVSVAYLWFGLRLIWDTIKAVFLLLAYRPAVVVVFGGYCSAPIAFVAWLLGSSIIAHEQNIVPGRASRVLFRLADYVTTSFSGTGQEGTGRRAKVVFTGNPIRSALAAGAGLSEPQRQMRSRKKFDLAPDKFTVLVMGGSQGAHGLNTKFLEAMEGLDTSTKSGLQVIHLTGPQDEGWVATQYDRLGVEHRVYAFVEEMAEVYQAADLTVTRAGASALFELAALGKAMILVPYPFAQGHQVANARHFADRGAALFFEEKDLTPELLRETLVGLMQDRRRLADLARAARGLGVPDAADRLAHVVFGCG